MNVIGHDNVSANDPLIRDLHVRDDVIAELRALDLGRAFHLAREIVGHAFAGDRAV